MKTRKGQLTIDNIKLGFVFSNYSDDEEQWNKVRIKHFNENEIDIENIDENSDFYLNVWSITDDEFSNINNSKRITF